MGILYCLYYMSSEINNDKPVYLNLNIQKLIIEKH